MKPKIYKTIKEIDKIYLDAQEKIKSIKARQDNVILETRQKADREKIEVLRKEINENEENK